MRYRNLKMERAFFHLTVAFCLGGTLSTAQEDTESLLLDGNSDSVYLYVGGDLSAKHGNGQYPVLSMTKRNIILDKGTSTKKVGKGADILLRLRPTIAYSLVDVQKFDFSFSSTIPASIEARALSEMMRHQWGTDTEIASIPKFVSRGSRSRIDYEQIEELNRETKQYQEDLQDESSVMMFDAELLVDTIHLDLELVPESDHENAYIALAVGVSDPSDNDKVGGNSQVVVEYLGTLRANRVEEFKLRMSLKPFIADDANCELFLFCENGKQVATNLSRGVKQFTREQIEALQNRQ